MILHISRDEKFLDSAINIFEGAAPGQNKYVIWQQDPHEKIPSYFYRFSINGQNRIKSFPAKKLETAENLKFIVKNQDRVTYAFYGTNSFFDLIGDLSQYRAIVFHSLVYNQAKLAVTIRKKSKIPLIWSPFGYEVYNMLPEFKRDLSKPLTAKKFKSTISLSEKLLNSLNTLKGKTVKKAIKQMGFCVIAIDQEYDLYREKIGITAKHLWFSYYPVDKLIDERNKNFTGNNILLGNSSTPSNNHFEALEFLSKLDIKDRVIISPLSYGDKKYGELVAEKGIALFGNKFRPLKEFMPLAEYNQIIMSCNIVIMNNIRQEAFGNILTALMFGATVYLNNENTIYQYLVSLGVKIFSINEHFDSSETRKLETLSTLEIKSNKEIISQKFSFENIVKNTQKLIADISD